MQKMIRLQFGASVMIDGVQETAARIEKCVSITYDGEKYIIIGKKSQVWVHPTNVQWAVPEAEVNGNKGSSGPGRART